jgi:thiosulfate dehydrogenase
MKNLYPLAIAAMTLALYVSVIAIGVRLGPAGLRVGDQPAPHSKSWHLQPPTTINPSKIELIEYGRRLFNETPIYGAPYTRSRISCSNCHIEGGIAPYASPLVGIVPSFPMYSKRAGRPITLEDRIQECMTRSEDGRPLPPDSPEMKALVAYINWLSEPHRNQQPFIGRGLKLLPTLQPNPTHGAEIYAAQCAGCHGTDGAGKRRPYPPLWGPDSFNDGAGMNNIEKMADFVQYNMPHDRKGILSPQDAFDVAAYIHQQPRPAFNHTYDHF